MGGSRENDLQALQGRWRWDPRSVSRFDGPYWFSFEGRTVSFGSGGLGDQLSDADHIPFEIQSSGGDQVLKLDGESAPTGLGHDITYKLDGERLVLTIQQEGRSKQYRLCRSRVQDSGSPVGVDQSEDPRPG
jgi:hypothetical protein